LENATLLEITGGRFDDFKIADESAFKILLVEEEVVDAYMILSSEIARLYLAPFELLNKKVPF
jgi:hypothetical protein